MTDGLRLGEPNFVSVSSVYSYVNNARNAVRPVISELEVASAELYGALREVPGEWIGNVDAKFKARIVARHLKVSSDAMRLSVVEMIRTYQSLLKHFVHVDSRPTGRRRSFDLNS